jgi:hypothetical protein
MPEDFVRLPYADPARAFYDLKDGKLTVNFSGWEQNGVVLEAPSL